MLVIASFVAATMGVIALGVIAFNWGALAVNFTRRGKHLTHQVSPVFLLPQLFLATAFLLFHQARIDAIPGVGFIVAGLADCGLWALGWHLLRHGLDKHS